MIKGLLSLSLAIVLVGCGPMYETRYSFSPPDNVHGRSCLMQCSQMQQQCELLEDSREDLCQERARLEQERCERDLRRQGKKEKWYDCSTESCSKDYERCQRQYRTCYEACGGKVTSERVCVMNCDQAAK